mgnify:CR=1 FL=1
MLVAMALAGLFTSSLVSKTAIENTAASTALFMDSFLSPLVQELATVDILPAERREALDRLLGADPFEDRFPHIEIWKEGGLVAYSTTPELVGRIFDPPDGLVAALDGGVSAQYTDLQAREHVIRGFSNKFLEIYVPVREHLSGRIIAVAEIHEIPGPLESKLFLVRLQSWGAIALVTLLVMLSLFGIVYRGNRMINAQQCALRRRLKEVKEVSDQNRILRERAQRASSRVSELNESYLRQVGAELHDGPAQLVSLAVLKVEHVRRAEAGEKREEELQALNSVLTDALRDIRTISKGLMLPEIEHQTLRDVIGRVVQSHERRTGTRVAVRCCDLARPVPHAVKICVYRFVQEGLNNAFRHAGGEGQAVACAFDGSMLSLTVQDSGGACAKTEVEPEIGLGLTGLRERVESLGGTFRMLRNEEEGTRLEMSLLVTGEVRNG